MKAYALTEKGKCGLEALEMIETPCPRPNAHEVLLKVESIGLNSVDYKLIEHPLPSFSYPHIFGLDAAGTVVAVGEKVTAFKVGDRVAGHNDLHQNGTFAEYALFPDYSLAKIPTEVSFETAAALLCGAMTAYQALFRKLNLTAKKTILIHAGAGGVGSIALQLAKLKQLEVLTTVSTSKKAFVKALHPDKIIDYKQEDVTKAVAAYTKDQGVDLIINTVGSEEAKLDLTERLAYNGELVCLVDVPQIDDPDWLFKNGLSVSVLNLGGVHRGGSATQKADLGQMATELLALAQAKRLNPNITEVLPFDKLSSGLKRLYAHDSLGKLIVNVRK